MINKFENNDFAGKYILVGLPFENATLKFNAGK
jgi:hypothetical protein